MRSARRSIRSYSSGSKRSPSFAFESRDWWGTSPAPYMSGMSSKPKAAASSGFSSSRSKMPSMAIPESSWKRKTLTRAASGYGERDFLSLVGIGRSRSSRLATSSKGVVSASMSSETRLSNGVSISWRSGRSSSAILSNGRGSGSWVSVCRFRVSASAVHFHMTGTRETRFALIRRLTALIHKYYNSREWIGTVFSHLPETSGNRLPLSPFYRPRGAVVMEVMR